MFQLVWVEFVLFARLAPWSAGVIRSAAELARLRPLLWPGSRMPSKSRSAISTSAFGLQTVRSCAGAKTATANWEMARPTQAQHQLRCLMQRTLKRLRLASLLLVYVGLVGKSPA